MKRCSSARTIDLMDISKIKKELTSWIDELNDEVILLILLALKDDQCTPQQWDDLPQQAQESALRGLKDLQAGRHHSSKQMWAEIDHRREQCRDGVV